MTERRRPRREGRLTRFAPALAVGVVFAGGTLVFADGGDPAQIHGCLTRDSGVPNLIVVAPDESCPTDTTPVHWPATDQGSFSELPPGLLGPNSQEILNLVPPSSGANKKIYKALGVRPTKTTEVVENFSFVTDGGVFGGQAAATCPSSHPYRVSGGHEYIKAEGYWNGAQWVWSYPVGDHGWFYQAALNSGGPAEVVGTVSLTCAVVKPQPNSVQKP